MSAKPPKLGQWSEQAVSSSPDFYAVKPTVPSAWAYFCGALGYWLPNAINRSAASRKALRELR
jgi:hypothetical protein